jgi:pimeloyl-ACP methyl ester carboxylesterase
MANGKIQHGKSSLHYAVVGNGGRPMLVFHGFGQDNNTLQSLAAALAETHTVYVFDLFFHGGSEWGYGEAPLEKTFWKDIMGAFLLEHRLEQFSLLGFSLGAKFALATMEAFPEKILSVYLLAPDGIKTSFWYSLATYPIIFRKIFKSMIQHHNRFVTLAKLLRVLGLLDAGMIRFATHQMNTQENRERVYYSWVVFRRLTFNLKSIGTLLNGRKIPLVIITGKYDKVITTRNMHHLLKWVRTYHLETVAAGHTGLIAASLPLLTARSQ